MLKYILTLFLMGISVQAYALNYSVTNKQAFTLPAKTASFNLGYLKVNDQLDIFHLKEKQFSNLGSIGDMTGHHLEVRYGLTSKDTFIASTQAWNIDYSDSTLKNTKYTLLNRYQFIANPIAFFNSLSLDIGIERNTAPAITLSSDRFLNALIQKIKPNSGIKINNGDIIAGDITLTFYNDQRQKIYPHISLKDLSSQTYYTRLLIGKKMTSSILSAYIGYRYTDITTSIAFYPDNTLIRNILKNKIPPSLNRSETDLELGFSYLLQTSPFIYEIKYEYHQIFRDKTVSYLNQSHTLDANIALPISRNTLLYLGGRLMMEQFNSDIPYLYNRYTKTQFDHKYGFAKFGFIYRFK